jgi:hypothetical protein
LSQPGGDGEQAAVDCSLLVAVPVGKQLPLQLQQLRSERFAISVARAVSW